MELGGAGRELLRVVEARAAADAMRWLERGVPSPGAFARGAFFGFYAGAGRRFAGPALALDAVERERLRSAGLAVPEVFSLSDLVRGALLLAAMAAAPASEHVSL